MYRPPVNNRIHLKPGVHTIAQKELSDQNNCIYMRALGSDRYDRRLTIAIMFYLGDRGNRSD